MSDTSVQRLDARTHQERVDDLVGKIRTRHAEPELRDDEIASALRHPATRPTS